MQEKTAMQEKIGRITLDYSHYSGADLYCDGAVEDELLEIARNHEAAEFSRMIEERASWPVLYHLSSQRENIVEWLPIEKDARILEVGSGCGAITGVLSRKAGSVTCVDLSKKRSLINAYRHKDCGNVTIQVGNFKDIEPSLPADFDYILLIGVLEYGGSYIGGDRPYEEFLNILKKHLALGGRIVIAIENQYGLKYFAGCREDHLGSYFGGIENYGGTAGVRTFGRAGLERLFEACGITESHFYYPYPDYKFMNTLFSDRRLPEKGELVLNLRNYDRDRMVLFDEKKAYEGILEEGLFPIFSNSYLVVLGEDFPVDYVRYSNDRAPEYAIRTELSRLPGEGLQIRKYPMTEEAGEHVRSMLTACEGLQKRYEGSGMTVNACRLEEEPLAAVFPFEEGLPLSRILDECLERGDLEGFHSYFDRYVERISYGAQAPVSDFDMAFSNILVQGDAWTLIDYEWTFGKAIDPRELAFRAVYCYLLEDEKRESCDLTRIMERLSMTGQEAQAWRDQEMDFQKFVTGKRRSMSELRELIGGRLLNPQKWLDKYEDASGALRVQIYEDRGQGYSEEHSYFAEENYRGENTLELELTVAGNIRELRIDPCMDFCMVKIWEMSWNGERIPLERKGMLLCNGRLLKSREKKEGACQPGMVFDTRDPNIRIRVGELPGQEDNVLCAKMEVVRLPESLAADVGTSVRRLL